MLRAELRLCNASAHDASRREPASDDVAHLVHDLRAAPLLMRQRLDTLLALLSLDELHVGRRSARRVLTRKKVDTQRVAMEARQGDELPDVAQLREVPNEGLHLRVSHARGVPVERGAEVVGEHLVGHRRPHLLGELRRLGEDGLARLHPDAVRVGREGHSALDAELCASLDAVIAFHGAGLLPIEMDLHAEGRGGLPHLWQRHLQGVIEPFACVHALRLESLGHCIRESHDARALFPILIRALAHGVREALRVRDRGALDVRVVDGVDVRVDHGRGFCVGARDDDQRRIQDVRLHPASDEALDVLARGNEYLAAHVPALFRAGLLVLDVDASGAGFDEHLAELHRGGEAAVASVRVRDDGVEIIHRSLLSALLWSHAHPLLELLPVVEKLRLEELIHLIRHSVVGVVRDVRSGLVRRGGRGRGLPAAHVHGREVLRHLHHLHRVQRAKGVRALACSLVLAQHRVELLGDLGANEVQRHGALELHDVLRLVRPGRVLETLGAHPRGHRLHAGGEARVLASAGGAHVDAAAHASIAGQDLALERQDAVRHTEQRFHGESH
mmetsp:Transcript_61276/g.171345  ORF Transcript_61276/g.171345 Transcript_61276/m.171345 type:complete len:559 (+) Transcript_61276:287-1963(+)